MMPVEEPVVPRGPPGRLLRRLLTYTRPYRLPMLGSVVLLLAGSWLVTRLPLVLMEAVNRYLAPAGLDTAERFAGILRMGLIYLAFAGGGALARFLEGPLTAWTGQRMVFDLRLDVFRHALRLAMSYFDRTPVGRLMTRVTSDADAVQRFVTEGVVGSLADLFTLGAALVAMAQADARLTGMLLGIAVPMLAVMLWFSVRLRRANRRIRERQAALNALTQECLAGMATIQLFARETQLAGRFDKRSLDLRAAQLEENRWFSAYWPVIEFAQAAAVLLTLGLAAAAARAGDAAALGKAFGFVAFVRLLFHPLGALADKASSMQQALAAAERLFGLLDTEPDVKDPPVPARLDGVRGRIEFDGVWFAYEDEHWALQDVRLDIRPGESVAVVGATGAGKTTLAALLTRFYDVRRGAVRLDGVDVRALAQADLRRRIGVVLQDPFLFSGPVASNLDLGDPALTRDRLEAAARRVNADRVIARLPQGWDTPLGERGGALSAGEKQLLALARVFAQNPDVVLIFDEATSSVDSESEALIQDATRRLMSGRTSLIIAHRLSTIRHCDRILVLRHGRITAQGTHRDLLASDPYYRHLYELLARPAGR